MQDGGSYTLASFAVDTGAEVRRLNAQVDLFWKQEHALYTALGMRNGIRVLDCGCGPGYLVQKLAALFPDSTFTGVDVDPELVRIASAAHANGDACNRAFLCQSLLEPLRQLKLDLHTLPDRQLLDALKETGCDV